MSIYEGTRIQQEYAHGRDEGRAWAEADLHAGSVNHDGMRLWRDRRYTQRQDPSGRGERAWYLGLARGYREAVRTLRDGKWGT